MKKLLLASIVCLATIPLLSLAAAFMPVQGGTGTTVKPTLGQILVGNSSGTYSPVATSTIGLEYPLTFSTPNLKRTGNTVSFPNFSIFLGQTGRATIPHNDAMNVASSSFTHHVTRPQGNSTYTVSKGKITDTFYWNIIVNTLGGITANMKKNTESVSAVAASGTIGASGWHEVRISYNDSTDRRLHLYVDNTLVASSAAFSTGTAFSNTDDIIFDMGAGVNYFTRPVFSSNPNYDPGYEVVTDANTIFYFPISNTTSAPVDSINGWTMTLNSQAKYWLGKELPLGLDAQLQALLDTTNNKIGSNFWWDKDNQGVAISSGTGMAFTILDWEGSEWVQFISAEDEANRVTGDLNFQTRQNFFEGITIDEGTNKTMGVATLSSGTVTVNTNKVTANSRIFLTAQSNSGTEYGFVKVSARSAGNSFTITSYRGNNSTTVASGDTSTVAWWIVEPGY